MKHYILVLLLFVLFDSTQAVAVPFRTEYGLAELQIVNGDTTLCTEMAPIYIFSSARAQRRFSRLEYNLKIVYPIALEANTMLHAMETQMMGMTRNDQQKYVRSMERLLKQKYTPVLKKMTLSQGKLLIKLIDRETDQTSYDLVKQLRGGFRAFFWQSIARLFGANLKDSYDATGEDQMIEDLITLYNLGLL